MNISDAQLRRFLTIVLSGLFVALLLCVLLAALGMATRQRGARLPTPLAVALSVVVGAGAAWTVKAGLEGTDEAERFLSGIPDFCMSQMTPSRAQFAATQNGVFLAVDNQARKLAVLTKRNGQASARVFERGELLDFEVTEDGDTVFSTRVGSALERAAIGGVLLGPLGAVVGAATAKKQSRQTVNTLKLRAFLNDVQNPTVEVSFLDSPSPRGSAKHLKARSDAAHWQGVLTALRG